MNIKNNMRYIKAGITLFAALAADMLVFFFLYRFDNIHRSHKPQLPSMYRQVCQMHVMDFRLLTMFS